MILQNIIDDIVPERLSGVTLYPASQLKRIFKWVEEKGERIEWIEAIMWAPNVTQPSLEHTVELKHYTDYASFRDQRFHVAVVWIAHAQERGLSPCFEIGISD